MTRINHSGKDLSTTDEAKSSDKYLFRWEDDGVKRPTGRFAKDERVLARAQRIHNLMQVRGLNIHSLGVEAMKYGLKSARHVRPIVNCELGMGVAVETISAIATALGTTTDYLHSGVGGPPSLTLNKNLPGWNAAEKEARERYPRISPTSIRGARERVSTLGDRKLDAKYVAGQAQAWELDTDRDEKWDVEKIDIQEDQAVQEKRNEDHYRSSVKRRGSGSLDVGDRAPSSKAK